MSRVQVEPSLEKERENDFNIGDLSVNEPVFLLPDGTQDTDEVITQYDVRIGSGIDQTSSLEYLAILLCLFVFRKLVQISRPFSSLVNTKKHIRNVLKKSVLRFSTMI